MTVVQVLNIKRVAKRLGRVPVFPIWMRKNKRWRDILIKKGYNASYNSRSAFHMYACIFAGNFTSLALFSHN